MNMAGGRVNGGRNSSVLSALLQNQRSSEPLDSLFLSGSSNSSSASFLGSRSMVSFEDVRGGSGLNRSLFHQYEHEDNGEDDLGEYLHQPGKKRRLTADQVQFLEKALMWKTSWNQRGKSCLQRTLACSLGRLRYGSRTAGRGGRQNTLRRIMRCCKPTTIISRLTVKAFRKRMIN